MYNVYITYYKNGNSIVSSWTKIFGVPANDDNGFPVSNPVVKESEDNAASFDFSMEMNSPYYDAFMQLKTLVCVEYDGDYIFFGRVLTIDGSTVYQTKRVHCEGAFGFMNDTHYEGVAEKDKKKISWSTYYDRIINNHNSMVNTRNPEKGIVRGTVTIDGSTQFIPTTEERKYEPSNWTQTGSLINSLVSEFGGHMVTRYRNGLNYLDWYKYYARDLGVNRPIVSIGENIIDINTSASNVDKLFTWVTPMGDTGNNGMPVYLDGFTYTDKNGVSHKINGKHIPVSIVRDVYTDAQLNDEFHSASEYSSAQDNYGDIYKPQTFASAKTQQQLWDYTIKWIKNCYFGIASSFTIRAYDMHIIDPSRSKILLGDCVNVQYVIMENGVRTVKTKKLVCKSVSYDLFNPDNNSYTFGIPSEVLNRSYSEGRGKSGSEQVGGGGGSGGGSEEKDIELTFDGIAKWIQAAAGKSDIYGGNVAAQSFIDNGEVTGTAKVYDPEALPEGETIDQHKDLIFNANIAGKITATGRNIYVATNPTMGCFAFIGGRPTNLSGALPITFWYLRTGKKQSLNYTPPSLMYTEEEEKLINIMSDWGINISSKDELNNVVNNFWIGLGDNAKGLKTQIWDPIQQKFVQPFKIAFEKAGSAIFGFLGLDGPKSKLTVSTNSSNNGSKSVEINAEDSSFNLGEWIQGLFTPKVNLDGNDGAVNAGKDNEGNWLTKMNATITYVDDQGITRTANGFVKANDFSIREIPSFKTKFIAVDTLVADYIIATDATINSLQTNKLSTNRLASEISYLPNVQVKAMAAGAISASGDIRTSGTIGGQYMMLNGKDMRKAIVSASVDQETNTLTLTNVDGESVTFKKAGGGGISSVVWGWSAGKARATIYFTEGGSQVEMSPELDDIVLNGDPVWADNKKSFTQKFNVLDEFGSIAYVHPYSLTFPTLESYNAGRDAGWARALQDCEFPDLGTDAKINVKLPNADEVAGTPRLREYTLSVDDNYAYLKRTDSGMSATAARVENPAYQRGKDAVGLSIDTREAKVKLNKSSNTITDVQIALNLGSVGSDGKRTVKVTANETDLLTNVLSDYANGKEAGNDAAGVSGSWSDNVYTVTRKANTAGKSLSCTVTAGAAISYDSSTHKYTATGRAYGNAEVKKTATKESGTEAYTAGKSDGNYAAGVSGSWSDNVYTVTRKANTAGKSLSCTVTAGAAISYDSSTHKYTATGRAYGNAEVKKTATKESGTEAYDAGYKSGFDADHDIWLIGGKASSGGSAVIDSGFYHIEYNKTSGRKNIAQSWEAPSCWLDIVTYDNTQEVLGYDTTLALVKTWSTGRRDVVKKWNTPPNGYDEAARAMKYPSAISGATTKSTIYITHPKVGGGTEQYSLTLKKDSGGAYIMHNSVLLARVT